MLGKLGTAAAISSGVLGLPKEAPPSTDDTIPFVSPLSLPKGFDQFRAKEKQEEPEKAYHFKDGEVSGPYDAVEGREKVEFKNLYYVNGFDTHDNAAVKMARALASSLESPSFLIYNDLYIQETDWVSTLFTGIEKVGATLFEKMGDGECVNEATSTLKAKMKAAIDCKEEIFIVAHSAGAICTNNAVRALVEEGAKQEDLGVIHILTVGSGVFEEGHDLGDGWPNGIGSLYHLYDERDPIAQVAGPGDWEDSDLDTHSFVDHYAPKITKEMLRSSGTKVLSRVPTRK